MKLRFFCFAAAAAVFPLAACSDDSPGPSGTAGAPPVAGTGQAGAAGQVTVGGGGQGTAGRPTFGGAGGSVATFAGAGSGGTTAGSGGSGGSPAPVAGGGSGGSATGGGTGGSVAGSATGGAGVGGGSAVPPTFATLRALLMETSTPYSCYGGLCHDFPENHYFQLKMGGQPLTDDQLYTMVTTYMTRDCGPAINKANPAESGLVKLLRQACGETIRMPYGKCNEDGDEGCVPPATVAAIEQWIAAGAPR